MNIYTTRTGWPERDHPVVAETGERQPQGFGGEVGKGFAGQQQEADVAGNQRGTAAALRLGPADSQVVGTPTGFAGEIAVLGLISVDGESFPASGASVLRFGTAALPPPVMPVFSGTASSSLWPVR